MKTRIMITMSLVILFFQVKKGSAQTAAEELKKISDKFISFKSFQTDFEYLLYSDASMKKQTDRQRGSYYKQGNSSYTKALNTETVINENYEITVNHDERIILTAKASEMSKRPIDILPINELNTINEKSGKLTLKKITTGISEVTLRYDAGRMEQMKIVYSTTTHEVKEIHIEFRDPEYLSAEKPYLVIRYNTTKYNHTISPQVFSEKRFVEIRQGVVKPIPALSKYKLLTNI
jgi:hypothetical protein